MDLGSVIIAVTGVLGTLGGSLLTHRASVRAKRQEMASVREHEEVRESLLLRRTCYVELNRDARQFTTALHQFLHAMRERGVEETDRAALAEAKSAHRDAYSQAQMVAPDEVLASAGEVNKALNSVYGQVRRLERGEPDAGETLAAAFQAQAEVWDRLRVMRTVMRRDLGVGGVGSATDDVSDRLPVQPTAPRSRR
ncbi:MULTISPECIES: hypothetical protein [unclassified Streptomyces]|uniref:hypothetical protein n=1 Tax=unclassified Streptomyces TaxID=2593676 RepID=UPI000AC94322|nr:MULTISPECIES: hypothetical protein [unclassified Streptomyces]